MRIRVLDVHADGCPMGGDECEHVNQELLPNETIAVTLTGNVRVDGRIVYDHECKVLTVERDGSDNVEIVVNQLDYQAKAMMLATEITRAEGAVAAANARLESEQPSGISVLLWLLGCTAIIGAQMWAALAGHFFGFVVASAVLVLAVAARA